ncbi:flavin reductase [Acidimangrovimonas pyrenivorans]|uniref:Flavin reductase n=1 Tax=Acidimangrovimonas pyrenivorans TaxID=2030798 RepID=A0ABV7ANF6_9RHOB
MTAPLRDRFLQGMARAAATVNVVTTDGPAGRAGVTVSAMSSISADGAAPTMLVCVHHQSASAAAILENGCFCVNVLRDDQSSVADTFARRRPAEGGDKFACTTPVPMVTGAPRLEGALVAFDCRVKSSDRVGTHHIFIGEVADIHLAESGTPLVYAARAYSAPVRLLSPDRDAEGHPLRLGTLASFGPAVLPELLRKLEDGGAPVALDLHEGDQRQLLELLRDGTIELAFLYDLGLPPDVTRVTLAELAPYVLLAADDPLAQAEEIALEDLAPRRMVLLDVPPSRDYFLSLFEGHGTPQVAYRARSLEMLRGMVAQGLGYALLATRPAGDISHDGRRLVTRPLAGRHASSRLVLCGRAGQAASPEAESFLLHCAAAFGLDLD